MREDICGYWNNHKKGKCRKNSINAEFLEKTVIEAILKYVNRPNVVQEIAQYMDREMDTTKLEKEIAEINMQLKELDKSENRQYEILSNIGGKYRNIRPEKIEANADHGYQIYQENDYNGCDIVHFSILTVS